MQTMGFHLRGHVDNYQSIDKAITDAGLPYRRLPQVNLDLNRAFDFMPLNASMGAEYVYFQHRCISEWATNQCQTVDQFSAANEQRFFNAKTFLAVIPSIR